MRADNGVTIRIVRSRRLRQRAPDPPPAPSGPARLLTIDELAGLFGVDPKTIAAWRAERGLPAIVIGRVVRFDPAQVAAWCDAHRDPSLAPPAGLVRSAIDPRSIHDRSGEEVAHATRTERRRRG
jgi:excisionase family DNA binding protein